MIVSGNGRLRLRYRDTRYQSTPSELAESMSENQPMATRAKQEPRQISLWKKLLFATVVYLAFFTLVELSLWATGVETLNEREDPFRGFSGLVRVFDRDGEFYRTRRGSLDTFNDQSFLAKKPAGGLRIFSLGGSSSYGFPWGAEIAFAGIVGDAMAASHPELHVEAVNASGISYAMHRLNIVADELLAYEPDVLIVYSGHNEFIETAFFEALKRRSTARTRLEFLLAHSHVYSAMQSAAEDLRNETPSTSEQFQARVRRDQTVLFSQKQKEAIVEEYHRRLARLVRSAQAAGIHVVLATVPCNLRDWRPEASTMDVSLGDDAQRQWSEAFVTGKQRLESGDFEAATASLERAVRLAPGYAETQFLLAKAYEGLARWDDARRAYQQACDTDASPVRRVSGINAAIREVARRSGALLVDVERIFEQRSEHGLVGSNLIEDYVHPTREGHELIAWHVWDAIERAGWFGKKSAADTAILDRLVAERRRRPMSENAVWFFNQGVVLENQGQTEAAIEKFRQALEVSPNYRGPLQNLGGLLNKTGRAAEALAVCERLETIDPANAVAHNNLGNALKRLGRLEEAIAHYEEALRLDPNFAEARSNLGAALHGLGRFEEAIAHYEEAQRLKPNLAMTQINWGGALRELGRFEQAAAHFEEALQFEPDNYRAWNHMAWLLATCPDARVRDGKRAVELAQRASWATGHKDASVLDTLAAAYAEAGNFDEAVRWQEKAVQLASDRQADILRRRLDIYESGKPFRADAQRR
jgi:tetratricopeptide (TPR) repeat protein